MNTLEKSATRLLERLAAYRKEEDWPQSMREAISELRATLEKAKAQ